MPMSDAEKRGRKMALDGLEAAVARHRRNYLLAKLRPTSAAPAQGGTPDAMDELAALMEAPQQGG